MGFALSSLASPSGCDSSSFINSFTLERKTEDQAPSVAHLPRLPDRPLLRDLLNCFGPARAD